MLQFPPSGQPHYAVAFSPDGRWLAAGGLASAVDLWDLHAPSQSARRIGPFQGTVIRAHFTADERLIVATTEQVTVFDLATGKMRLQGHFERARRAACSHDGNRLVTVGPAGLHRWNLRGAFLLHEREYNPSGSIDVALTSGAGLVFARNDTRDGGLIEVFRLGAEGTGHSIPVPGRPHRIACSADGELAAALALGNLSVWHLPTRTAVVDRYANTHGGWLSVAFAPHGRRLVTGGLDGTVAVWDAASPGPPLRTFQWGVGPIYAVAFDQNGQCAAVAGHAGALVWDVDD